MIYVENGTLQTAINNSAVGETIMLTSDITLTSRVTVSNVVTIDLNGYAITGDIDDGYGAIYVGTKGALTVIDSSSKQTGCIVNNIKNAIGNYGTVVIYGGTFIGNYALYNFYYSDTLYGTSVIYGGTFKSVDGGLVAVANSGDLTVNGGSIGSVHTSNVLSITSGSVGTLYVAEADYNPANQSTSINGGHLADLVVADDSSNKIIVSGGTFDNVIDSKYLADGFKLSYDKNTGTYVAAASQGLKVIATSSSKIRDLVIRDGQLIFIQDLGRIAFDFKGKRKFYNQIVELNTEAERQALDNPLNGYYFVIDTAVLWSYKNGWIQITEKPQDVVFVGVELPSLGQANKLYANTTEGAENISVWSEELDTYVVVADKTQSMTSEEVIALFN